jgi:hypothetical protein
MATLAEDFQVRAARGGSSDLYQHLGLTDSGYRESFEDDLLWAIEYGSLHRAAW